VSRTDLLGRDYGPGAPEPWRVGAAIPQQLAKLRSLKVAAGIAALVVGVGTASAATASAATASAATASAATAWTAPAPAPVATATASCRSYPRPGTIATAPVPALVLAEYRALRRPRRPEDRIAVRRLGRLPESGILAAGIRLLATVPGGARAYLVPSLHLLAAPMRPVRCVPAAQRARQASLLATLRHEYAQHGLCVVIVDRRGAVDNCGVAPGTVAALLHGPGAPAFGVVPDGIDSVTVSFRGRQHPTRLAFVHRNFWLLPASGGPVPTACGLDWLGADQTVLRTVRRCTPDTS
jgi:hypothetical protein